MILQWYIEANLKPNEKKLLFWWIVMLLMILVIITTITGCDGGWSVGGLDLPETELESPEVL